MPHLVLEYSQNLEPGLDVPGLLLSLHETLAGQGVDRPRIKSRAVRLDKVIVGEMTMNEGAMVHVTLSLLPGRDTSTRQIYGVALHTLLKEAVSKLDRACATTLEVREMESETYWL